MAHSMTGFGRGEKVFDTRHYSVELKSVNSRFCDINIRMPKLFNFADAAIRKLISDTLVRGKVDAYISFEDDAEGSSEVIVNTSLVKAYSDAVALFGTNLNVAEMNTIVGYVYDMLYGDSGGYPSYASAAAIILFSIVLTITVINLLVRDKIKVNV